MLKLRALNIILLVAILLQGEADGKTGGRGRKGAKGGGGGPPHTNNSDNDGGDDGGGGQIAVIIFLCIVGSVAVGVCLKCLRDQGQNAQQEQPIRMVEYWIQPELSDEQWVERFECPPNLSTKPHNKSVFIDGKYSGYSVNQGLLTHFYDIPLHFHKHTGTVKLHGEKLHSDAFGTYSVTGNFSEDTNAIALQMHYIGGPEYHSQISGHVLRTRLFYHAQIDKIHGEWIVTTGKCRGTGVFFLWLTEKQSAHAVDNIEMAKQTKEHPRLNTVLSLDDANANGTETLSSYYSMRAESAT